MGIDILSCRATNARNTLYGQSLYSFKAIHRHTTRHKRIRVTVCFMPMLTDRSGASTTHCVSEQATSYTRHHAAVYDGTRSRSQPPSVIPRNCKPRAQMSRSEGAKCARGSVREHPHTHTHTHTHRVTSAQRHTRKGLRALAYNFP